MIMFELSECIFHFFRSSCVVKVAGLVFFNPLSDIRHDLPLPLIQKHLRVVPSADSALEQDCSSVTLFVSVSPHQTCMESVTTEFLQECVGNSAEFQRALHIPHSLHIKYSAAFDVAL